ncbi:MAG: hypothetical protein ABEH80_07115 [Halobaculum sp.]
MADWVPVISESLPRSRRRSPEPEGERGVAPTVGKLLELGLALIVVAGLVTAATGFTESYRTRAADATAQRQLAGAAERIESAVPPLTRETEATMRVPLPATIRDSHYRVVVDGRTLDLRHPHSGVDARVRLSVSVHVETVSGEWQSSQPAVVVVRRTADGLAVELRSGRRVSGGDDR